ncbi:MAG: molybdenum cofactor guanylyltransferase [Planctomycetaceae bacterium]
MPIPASGTAPRSLALRVGAVVLCGGRSSRMGTSKALLPVGREVMLQRVCRVLAPLVQTITVVAAEGQELPDLSNKWLSTTAKRATSCITRELLTNDEPFIRVVRDPVEYRGPLAGLAAGLADLTGEVDCVYASACDAPLLRPEFVSAMIDSLGDAEIAVPFDRQFHHPLAAVYRVAVLPKIEELLAADRLRPVFLFEKCLTREVSTEELRRVDPTLDSLCNTNTPEEYAQVLASLAREEAV